MCQDGDHQVVYQLGQDRVEYDEGTIAKSGVPNPDDQKSDALVSPILKHSAHGPCPTAPGRGVVRRTML